MELLTKGFDFTLRKRKRVILLALCGFSSYGMYKVYNLPSVSRKRKRFVKLLGALISIVEMVSDSAETLGVISTDLNEYLASDSDQIPNSLKQLSKILVSDEFSKSLGGVFEAATLGVLQGYHEEESSREIKEAETSSFNDDVIDKLTSKSGTGFVSVVVGSFARNLVMGFYSNEENISDLKIITPKLSTWVDTLSKDKSKLVMGDLIKTFVSTVVSVYLDRGTGINLYDGIFSGLTDPKHKKHVKDIVVYVCSGAVETLIKTSHQVLTSPQQTPAFC